MLHYLYKKYLEDIPKFGTLNIKDILVEDDYPILVTCTNKDDKLFLCLFKTTTPEEWVMQIVETNDNILTKLTDGKISVRKAYMKAINDKLYIVRVLKDLDESPIVHETYKISKMNKKDLPAKVFLSNDD